MPAAADVGPEGRRSPRLSAVRRLGASGPEVGAIGYGAMPLSWAYGAAESESEAIVVIHRALDLGSTLIDTADSYGPFTNELLVGRALGGRRDDAVVATKVGLIVTDPEAILYRRNGRPDHIARACDASLARLGVEAIDLYQLHRVDPAVEVEESVGAMAGLVAAGKVKAIGLSEVDVSTLERAMAVHPLASVQSELSLWTRGALDDVVPWCSANGVAFLPYSPLGRGFLTGRLDPGSVTSSDFRSQLPRFQPTAMEANRQIIDGVTAVADRHDATNAQVALAWLLAQAPMVIPIPGTKQLGYLEDNVAAAALSLTTADLADLAALPEAVGERY